MLTDSINLDRQRYDKLYALLEAFMEELVRVTREQHPKRIEMTGPCPDAYRDLLMIVTAKSGQILANARRIQ